MAEKNEIILTDEEEKLFSEVEKLVLSAISERCAGCSTANFTPRRIAGAVVKGGLSKEGAVTVTAGFARCPGLFDAICHFSPAALNEAASHWETPQPAPISH